MNTKQIILETLEQESGFFSGEALSQKCGVSRTAVWKQIQKLQEEGYDIESQRKLGYRLLSRGDVLNEQEIRRRLSEETSKWYPNIFCFDEIDSTNLEARRKILKGHGNGTVIVSEMQSAGKGRLGRHWESPKGTGIWFSVILEPGVSLQETSQYSFVMAVAVAEAIRKVTGLPAELKWPNDILIDGKKVCGILLELVAELTQVQQLIVGIGVNANQEMTDFPEDVRKKATSLAVVSGETVKRTELLGTILEKIQENCILLEKKGFKEIRTKWMDLSCVIGKEVQVVKSGDVLLYGIAEGIDESGALLVQTESGTEHIIAGDVSLRAKNGEYFSK